MSENNNMSDEPSFGSDDDTANYQNVKQFLMDDEKALGKKYGFEYAQAFHYIGPKLRPVNYTPSREEYIEKNAVPLR